MYSIRLTGANYTPANRAEWHQLVAQHGETTVLEAIAAERASHGRMVTVSAVHHRITGMFPKPRTGLNDGPELPRARQVVPTAPEPTTKPTTRTRRPAKSKPKLSGQQLTTLGLLLRAWGCP